MRAQEPTNTPTAADLGAAGLFRAHPEPDLGRSPPVRTLDPSAGHMRLALAAAHLGTWERDLVTEGDYWSDAMGPIFGRPAGWQPVNVAGWMRIVHPEDRARVREAMAAMLAGGPDYDVEYRVVNDRGETLGWVAARGSMIRDASGAPSRVLGVASDITARKRVEEELVAAVAERDRIAEGDRFLVMLDDAIRTLHDPDEMVRTATRLLGEHLQTDSCAYADFEQDHEALTLVGGYYRSGVSPALSELNLAAFGPEVVRAHETDEPFVCNDVELDPCTKEHREAFRAIDARSIIAAPIHREGKFLAGISVHQSTPRAWTVHEVKLVRAVANRCWESIQRVRAERITRESEARLRQLADTMPQIVFIARPDGRPEYFNRRWYEYSGLPEGSIPPDDYWATVYRPDHLEDIRRIWSEAIRSGKPYEFEYPLRRVDGAWRWHLVRGVPVRDEDGRVVRWMGTNTDVHDLKTAQIALQEQRVALERSNADLENFAYIASHDLKEPLRGIASTLAFFQEDHAHELSQGALDKFAIVNRLTKRMYALIDALLVFSRAGRATITPVPVRACDLASSACESVVAGTDRPPVCLSIPEGAMIWCDPVLTGQVLTNLLSNAFKYARQGVPARVELGVEPIGERAKVWVRDNGIGIDPRHHQRIFDMFRRLHPREAHEGGLGAGLSIAKRIIERQGGTIEVDSAPGAGSTFSFTI